jgi:hypothetical protein
MQQNVRIEEQFTDRVISEELLSSCRNHIETLQNLNHLTSIDAADTNQVRLNVKMMEWHLRNLAEVLLVPLRHVTYLSTVLPQNRECPQSQQLPRRAMKGCKSAAKANLESLPIGPFGQH